MQTWRSFMCCSLAGCQEPLLFPTSKGEGMVKRKRSRQVAKHTWQAQEVIGLKFTLRRMRSSWELRRTSGTSLLMDTLMALAFTIQFVGRLATSAGTLPSHVAFPSCNRVWMHFESIQSLFKLKVNDSQNIRYTWFPLAGKRRWVVVHHAATASRFMDNFVVTVYI